MSSDDELSEPLATRDFHPIDCAFPGDWATNERYTIQITSQRDISGDRIYHARVYDAPADALELPRMEQLSVGSARDHVDATRMALEGVDDLEERTDGEFCDEDVWQLAALAADKGAARREIVERLTTDVSASRVNQEVIKRAE